jgi:sulfate permease, SulP family
MPLVTPLETGQSQQLQPSKRPNLLPNVLAGFAVGLVSLTYNMSFAALIFSGDLSPYFPQGVGSALVSSMIVGTIVALRSSFPFAIGGPGANGTAILALMTTAIAEEVQRSGRAAQLLPTVWMAITLSTLSAGLVLYGMGRLHLGRWARFIPYPVMGGFLAGTGWLIARSSFKVMAGLPLEWGELPRLMQSSALIHWLPGVLFTGVLIGVTRYFPNPMVLPAMLLGAIAGFNLLWHLVGFMPLTAQGWFLEPFSSDQIWHSWNADSLTQIDWQVLIHQSGTLMALMVVVVIALLLNITSIELVSQQDSTLDRELCTNGIANLAIALYGGIEGQLSFNQTLLNRSFGANSRLAGLTAAAFCGAILLFGSTLMTCIPRWILGGVLLMIGVKLLLEWIWFAWFKFPHLDYALILIILVSIALWGFLDGVGVGLIIACALFIFNYSRHQIIRHTFSGTTHLSNVCRSFPEQRLLRQQGNQIQILLLQGYLFFGTANTLHEQVCERLRDSTLPQLQFVVLDFRLVSGLDSSAVLSFIKMRQFVHQHKSRLVFTHLHPTILQQLQQGGCLLPQTDVIQVFSDLDRGIEWCEDRILDSQSLRRRRALPLALQMNEVFANANHVSSFIRYLQKIQVSAEHRLFCPGDFSDTLYFIESGQVTVVLQLRNGQTRRLRTFGAGMILGEHSFYLGVPHTTSAIADQPSTLYCLSHANLQTMRQEQPQVAAAFQDFIICLLADRLVYAYKEIEELL